MMKGGKEGIGGELREMVTVGLWMWWIRGVRWGFVGKGGVGMVWGGKERWGGG